jgi:hypothetical protein
MNNRFGQSVRVTLDDAQLVRPHLDADLLDLHAALRELATFDFRKSQIAEPRFFSGLSLKETARPLGVSLAGVEGDWQAARVAVHRSPGNAS